jgi:hypothetical protein
VTPCFWQENRPKPDFSPPPKEKKRKKEEIVTNLVDRMPMYDLQVAAIKSTRHNI